MLNACIVVINFLTGFIVNFQFYSKILKDTLDIDFESIETKNENIINKSLNQVNSIKQEKDETRLKKLFSELNFLERGNSVNHKSRKILNNSSNLSVNNLSDFNSTRKFKNPEADYFNKKLDFEILNKESKDIIQEDDIAKSKNINSVINFRRSMIIKNDEQANKKKIPKILKSKIK